MEQKTFFSRKSGMEVSKGRTIKDNWVTGCVFMKGFPLEKGGRDKQIAVKLLPEEAWSIAKDIEALLAGKFEKKEVLFHNIKDSYTTSISLATKEHEGRKFRMVFFNRKRKGNDKGDSVPFPMRDEDISFLAALLRKYSLEVCYREREEIQEEPDYPGSNSKNGSGSGSSGNDKSGDDEFDDIPF